MGAGIGSPGGQFAPKALLMVTAAVSLALLCQGGQLSFPGWLVLAAVLAVYLADSIREASRGVADQRRTMPKGRTVSRRRMARELGLFVLGAGAVAIGSRLLVAHGAALPCCWECPREWWAPQWWRWAPLFPSWSPP